MREFLRFGITGVGNTLVYWGVYLLLLMLMPYLAAHILGWLAGTVFSFYVNCLFTFRVRPTWKRFISFPLAPLTNLVLSTLGAIALIQWLGVPEQYGTVIASVLSTPATFLVARAVLGGKPQQDADHAPVIHPVTDERSA